MKRISKVIAAAITLACLAPLGTFAQTVLKFSHYADTSHPGHGEAVQFATNVEKHTNGPIKIQVFPANQLGGNPECCSGQARRDRLRRSDAGQLDKFEKAFAAVMMPFAFANLAEAHKALDGPVMDWLSPARRKAGLQAPGQLGMGLPPHHQLEGPSTGPTM